jgi:hypothetical protein
MHKLSGRQVSDSSPDMSSCLPCESPGASDKQKSTAFRIPFFVDDRGGGRVVGKEGRGVESIDQI